MWQVGDYITDHAGTMHISPIYQIVHIEDRGSSRLSYVGYGVLDYSCNPPLRRWGDRKASGPLDEHAVRVPEMYILARVAKTGEYLCGPPEGWVYDKEREEW